MTMFTPPGFTPPGRSDEQTWLSRIEAEGIELEGRLNYFSAVARTATSVEIRGFINELYAFRGRFMAWRRPVDELRSAGHSAASLQLDGVMNRVEYNLQTYQFTYNSRVAFERFQQR
jgi:hypothetical protein